MFNVIQYNDATFRALFPAFSNAGTYPTPLIQLMWDNATAYISDVNGGCYVGGFSLAQQTLALNQMTAHLLYLNTQIVAGNMGGIVTGATIDKVSVTLEPPPEVNQWQWWLNQSPYGQQVLALLQAVSVGGFFVSTNMPARAGF